MQNLPNIPLASAIAGGAVVWRLLEVLANKGILSSEEIRTILGDAQRALANSPDDTVIAGARVVGSWYDRFKSR
jgi:hypothetical protein